MTAFLLRRVAHAVTVIAVVLTITFLIIHLAPGGPAVLADPKLGAAERAAIEQELGLDRPLPEQYAMWIGRTVRGDFGRSFLYQVPNIEAITARLPSTLLLTSVALLLAIVVAVPLGALAAERPGSRLDRVLSFVSFTSMALPTFWLGIGAIFLFAVVAHVLPAGGSVTLGATGSLGDRLRHLILPAAVLSAGLSAELFRYTRSTASAEFRRSFVRTARAKGAARARVAWHAVRNTVIPVVTILGLQLPRLVGGAAITETVFAWPGMGRLGVEAALGRDYPLVMAMTVFISVAVVTVNILIDLIYAWSDPRVRIRET